MKEMTLLVDYYTFEPKGYDATESFQEFLNYFELISIVNNWDYVKKLIVLAGC